MELDEAVCGDGYSAAYDAFWECVESCETALPGFDCGTADSEQVSRSAVCDGYNDCPNGSDEANCGDKLFDCGQGYMISSDWLCDLSSDCDDGRDEGPECAKLLCE